MPRILLVDDNEFIQRMFARALAHDGYEILSANDGTVALEVATKERPDLIVMDVMMPNMNGMRALESLKANEVTKTIPVIMLSAYDNPGVFSKALEIGAARYILKDSMDAPELVTVVKEVIAEHGKVLPPADQTTSGS
jgi:CheY-like chemotaxis protein